MRTDFFIDGDPKICYIGVWDLQENIIDLEEDR